MLLLRSSITPRLKIAVAQKQTRLGGEVTAAMVLNGCIGGQLELKF